MTRASTLAATLAPRPRMGTPRPRGHGAVRVAGVPPFVRPC